MSSLLVENVSSILNILVGGSFCKREGDPKHRINYARPKQSKHSGAGFQDFWLKKYQWLSYEK